MKKILLLVCCSLSLLACHDPLAKPNSKILVLNYDNQGVSWNHFPIQLAFYQGFPEDKKRIIRQEIDDLNTHLKFSAFIVSYLDNTQNSIPQGDQVNLLYWGQPSSLNNFFSQNEQAKTTVYWTNTTIYEADISFNISQITPDLDFATLVRHELSHALGMRHLDNFYLMNPVLPPATTRPWNDQLLSLWKKDIQQVPPTQISPNSFILSSLKGVRHE